MVNTVRNNPPNKMNAGGLAGSLIGGSIGVYCGIILLIPLITTGLVFWLGRKLFDSARQIVLPAFGVQAGHLLWFAMGALITGNVSASLMDMLWLAAGLAWLAIRPGKMPLYFLALYQIISLPVNVTAFCQASFGSPAHKALLVHIIWRVLALGLMIKLYLKLRQQAAEPAVAIEP